MRAVLFRSQKRFDAFHECLRDSGVDVTVLDFDAQDWVDIDFDGVDIVIYFPSFEFTSNHPQALTRVTDNLMTIHRLYPHLRMFPCPNVIPYYSDKYRQWLFLRSRRMPMPETYAMTSERSLDVIARNLGFPLVVKNRFGAGGAHVFKVASRKELRHLYRQSQLDVFRWRAVWHFARMLRTRTFLSRLIKQRRMAYPFLSSPLLAQRFVPHECDIKTVVGNGNVVEAHWRRRVGETTWKANLGEGAFAEWRYVPNDVIELSERLARELNATWLNIDIINDRGQWVITEFSPVWRHHTYQERPTFVYCDDYNIPVPPQVAQALERLIVESLVGSALKGRNGRSQH